MERMLYSLVIAGLALMVDGLPVQGNGCDKLISSSSSSRDTQLSAGTTSFKLQCEKGRLLWHNPLRRRSHILQFSKQSSFTVCLSGGNGVSVFHLKGMSKRQININEGIEICLQSRCNFVSLLLVSSAVVGQQPPTSSHFNYSYRQDERCPRCSDSCLQESLCSADYVFVGKAVSSWATSDAQYTTTVKLELFIRYNGSYLTQDTAAPPCTLDQSPSEAALLSHSRVPTTGTVTLLSHCRLDEGKRYFFSADLDRRIRDGRRLTLSCAQEDHGYARFTLNSLLQKGVCCP